MSASIEGVELSKIKIKQKKNERIINQGNMTPCIVFER